VLLDKLVNDEPLPLDITPFLADRFEAVPVKQVQELELA
jgi:hydrogen cyanide synthase HcnC